jgi:hypothetical protein
MKMQEQKRDPIIRAIVDPFSDKFIILVMTSLYPHLGAAFSVWGSAGGPSLQRLVMQLTSIHPEASFHSLFAGTMLHP